MKILKTYLFYFLVLVYVSGTLGVIFKPSFFIPFTPFTLILTCAVFLLFQEYKNPYYMLAFFGVATIGFASEWIGVKTGIVFGKYYYGKSLGPIISGVPLLISLNWALLISAGVAVVSLHIKNYLLSPLFAATLITGFDYLMEQSAARLDYWYFNNHLASLHNYLGWFCVSFIASAIFYKPLSKGNYKIATNILLLQVLFLELYLLLIVYLYNAMELLQPLLIIILTFILTEFSAWANHKFIMHGSMWHFHSDHHKKDHNSWFERNDIFFLMYAIPSWLLIMFGMMDHYAWYTWIGFGIALYGFAYFFVHDIIIHQRFKILTKSKNLYVLALRRAHKMHHKHVGKEDGESFGMLIIHPKYFREAKKLQQAEK